MEKVETALIASGFDFAPTSLDLFVQRCEGWPSQGLQLDAADIYAHADDEDADNNDDEKPDEFILESQMSHLGCSRIFAPIYWGRRPTLPY